VRIFSPLFDESQKFSQVLGVHYVSPGSTHECLLTQQFLVYQIVVDIGGDNESVPSRNPVFHELLSAKDHILYQLPATISRLLQQNDCGDDEIQPMVKLLHIHLSSDYIGLDELQC
jgi:hypothetical protein